MNWVTTLHKFLEHKDSVLQFWEVINLQWLTQTLCQIFPTGGDCAAVWSSGVWISDDPGCLYPDEVQSNLLSTAAAVVDLFLNTWFLDDSEA